MGNLISEQPEEEGPHVEHQERFFKEYQELLLNNPSLAKEDSERWDNVKDTILDMSIDHKAEYCDYVTRKICEMDEIVLKSLGEQLKKNFEHMIRNRKKVNTSAIANCAKTIISQKDEILKAELLAEFEKFLEIQRETNQIRENIGDMAKGMADQITKQFKEGADPMDVSRNLISQMMGPAVADQIFIKFQANMFIQQKINEGKTVKEAMKLTRDKFNLPAGTKFDVKLTLTVEDSEEDEESSE